MKYIILKLIGLYRRYLSPLKGRASCRFTPTCSQYASEVIEEWGLFYGIALSVWRILRCNPFCRGGIDMPPKRIPYDPNYYPVDVIVFKHKGK